MKLIKYEGGKHLAEIFQSIEVKFSFIKKDPSEFKQIHKPVKCRDFLGDCIWSKETNKPVSIYGFKYYYEDTPFDEDKLQLSLTFPDIETKEIFMSNLDIIEDLEKRAGTKEAVVSTVDEDELSIIIEADAVWQSSPWKISLYTFFLKKSCYKAGELQLPESTYEKALTPEKLNSFLSKIHTPFIEVIDNCHTAHNNNGFYSILTKGNKNLYKQIFEE